MTKQVRTRTIKYVCSGDNYEPQPLDIVVETEHRGNGLIIHLESYDVYMNRRLFWWPSRLFRLACRALWVNTKRRLKGQAPISHFTTISDAESSLGRST